ncbi:MAG: hypothetical protein MUF34_32020 [Polyangiaceae bacterium]|nr:hypothetical protein [Polyangiaceae bacterium]
MSDADLVAGRVPAGQASHIEPGLARRHVLGAAPPGGCSGQRPRASRSGRAGWLERPPVACRRRGAGRAIAVAGARGQAPRLLACAALNLRTLDEV